MFGKAPGVQICLALEPGKVYDPPQLCTHCGWPEINHVVRIGQANKHNCTDIVKTGYTHCLNDCSDFTSN